MTEQAWLDRAGVITHVDAGWAGFCCANGGDPAACGPGVSYLEVCDSAGDEASVAVASSIRQAGSGELTVPVSMLIACHAPDRRRWFELTVVPRTDDVGAPLGAQVILTPSRAASVLEGEGGSGLPEAHDWLWQTVDSSPAGILLAGPEGDVLFVNKQAATITGRPAGSLVGRSLAEVLQLDEVPAAGHTRRKGEGADGSALELRLRCPDDTFVVVEVGLSPMVVGATRVTIVTLHDVTASRADDRARRRLLQILDLDPDSVFIVDAASGAIEYASHGVTAQLGYPRAELVGRTLTALTAEAPPGQWRSVLQEHRRGGPGHRHLIEVTRRAADGELVPFDSRGQLVHVDGEPDKFLIVDRDARPRREAEASAVRREKLSSLNSSITTLVLSQAPTSEVFDTVVTGADRLVEAASLCLLIWDNRAGAHRLRSAAGRAAATWLEEDPEFDEEDVAAWARSDAPIALDRPPGWLPPRVRATFGPGLVVPLPGRHGRRPLLVAFRRRGRAPFTADEVEALTGLTSQLATVVELGTERSRRARLELVEERARISRDLHDLVIQEILGIGIQVMALKAGERVTRDDASVLVSELEAVVANLRLVVFEMDDEREGGSLAAELGSLCVSSARFLGFTPSHVVEGDIDGVDGLSSRVEKALLAVLREALSNVARHAGARAVDVHVTLDRSGVTLTVSDDGRGICAGTRAGSGIRNMRHRAARLGGTLTVGPGPGPGPAADGGTDGGRGTTITWSAPAAGGP